MSKIVSPALRIGYLASSKSFLQKVAQLRKIIDVQGDNIMAQANNLRDVEVPTLLPGIRVNTSPTNHHPLRQLQLQKIEGMGWQRFGPVIEGANL